MNKYFLQHTALSLGVLIFLAAPLIGQTTWIYQECRSGIGASEVRLANYSVDSLIPGDPVFGGKSLGSIRASAIQPNPDPTGAGAVAIDKIQNLLFSTGGIPISGTLEIEVTPIPGSSCPTGSGPVNLSITNPPGGYPFQFQGEPIPVTGMSVEYWTAPNGIDEPYRMWASAGTQVGLALYSSFWLTSNPPGGESQYRWDTSIGVRPIPNGNFPVQDIAFGVVEFFDRDQGRYDGVERPCLFGCGGLGFIDVWDVSTNLPLYSSFSGHTLSTGIAIDTSMPVDLGVGAGQLPGPRRRISGRVLVVGTRAGFEAPYIIDLNDRVFSSTTWVPRIESLCTLDSIKGMAYSAETVSLGSPTGMTCTGSNGYGQRRASSVKAGIHGLPNTIGAPSQPIVGVKCINGWCQTPGGCTCTNQPNPTGFRVESCGFISGNTNFLPFLVLMKNRVSPVQINGQDLLVNPYDPASFVLRGATSPGTLKIIERSSFTRARTQVPMGPLPHAVYPQSGKHHYYYGQWIFVCATQSPRPTDLTRADFFTSEPFRIAVSNPN